MRPPTLVQLVFAAECDARRHRCTIYVSAGAEMCTRRPRKWNKYETTRKQTGFMELVFF